MTVIIVENMSSNQPVISVIVPVYNVYNYLEECIESILAQSLTEIELICVNDGSTDGSMEILKRYAAKDPRVKLIDQVNSGAAIARNNGFKSAKGEYVIFYDSDDYMRHDALELLYNDITLNGSDISVGRSCEYIQNENRFNNTDYSIESNLVDEKRSFNCADYSKYLCQIFLGWAWDKLYRRAFIEQNNLEFQNLRHQNDTYFVIMSVIKAKTISYIDDVIFTHRVHSTSLAQTRIKQPDCFAKALDAVYQRLKSDGIYDLYEQSFINYCIEVSHWSIDSIGDYNARQEIISLFNTLDSRYKILNRGSSYYYYQCDKAIKRSIKVSISAYRCYLLHFIPLIKCDVYLDKRWYLLFNIFPLYKIKRYSATKRKHYLFGFIPFLKFK